MAGTAISAAVTITAFLTASVYAQAQSCPTNGPLSCQNTTVQANTCCFNAPGGSFLQTQFWDYDPATGPADAWTVHGLWPDHCDGTYDANCDSRRAYTNITQILQASGNGDLLSYMQTYWKDYQGDDESFWEHEWGKHGTCISTLEPRCYTNYKATQEVPDYFGRTISLYKNLNSYNLLKDAGIIPDKSTKYSLSAVQAALSKGHSNNTPVVRCKSGAINEIWYYFNVRGSVQSGDFVPVGSDGTTSNCPSSVSYIPKGSSNTPSSTSTTKTATATATATATSSPTSSPTPFSGKGYLNVITTSNGNQNGCLISSGKWYTTGTCATYTTASSGNGFTLKGSKGFCAILSDGSIDCAQTSGSVFTGSSAGALLYGGSGRFFAAAVAQGSTQQTVFVNSRDVALGIQWQGI